MEDTRGQNTTLASSKHATNLLPWTQCERHFILNVSREELLCQKLACLIQAAHSQLSVQDRVPVLFAEALLHDDWPSQKLTLPHSLYRRPQQD